MIFSTVPLKYLIFYGSLIVLASPLSGCGGKHAHHDVSVFCTPEALTTAHCSFSIPDTVPEITLVLRSSHVNMPFEERIELQGNFSASAEIVRSEIIGQSMYMGRIPVVWEQSTEDALHWRTQILLGACVDPHMVWALRIQVQLHNVYGAQNSGRVWLHIPFQSNPF